MTSDARYVYLPSTHYEYPPYPPPPPAQQQYDNSVPQTPRQVRPPPPPAQPQSPHQQQYAQHPHPHPYPPPPPSPYVQHPYMTHPPPPPPQWPAEAWAQYSHQAYSHPQPPHPQQQPQPPPQPQPQSQPPPPHAIPAPPPPPQSHDGGHYAPIPASPNDQRGYPGPPPAPGHPDPRRIDERIPSGGTMQQQLVPRREKEETPGPAAGTPPALDFMKMLHSYRLLIDDANDISRPTPPVELVDRMLHSANQGAQTLHGIRTTIAGGSAPPRPLSPKHEQDQQIPPPSAGMDISENGVNGSKKSDESSSNGGEGQTCLGCKATSTPEWRRGPMGPRTLCNACGLVYAKIIKRRVRDDAAKKNGNGVSSKDGGDDSGEDSEEDEEYDSQGRRSEVGD